MLNNLLTIGKSALTTAQAWVTVTGDNIANADTEGYCRRYVVQNEAPAVTTYAGEVGLGANAEQVLRYFDKFLEDSYINESTLSSRWTEYDNIMETLESIFNESNTTGLNDTINKFFNSWQKLALSPEDPAVRQSVINYGQTLDDMFASMNGSIKAVQDEMNIYIDKTVNRINEISEGIAKLNYQIDMSMKTPDYSPNSLYDQRDLLVEELATLIDVETIDSGAGSYHVQLKTGQPLVDRQTTYKLAFDFQKNVYDSINDVVTDTPPIASNRLMGGSQYAGNVVYSGSDDFEYTLKILSIDPDPNQDQDTDTDTDTDENVTTVEFKVSLDGGNTWIKDDNGKEQIFTVVQVKEDDVDKDGNPIKKDVVDTIDVKELTLKFSTLDNLTVGDCFDILPKKGLYWIEPTLGPENVTPQVTLTGSDNTNRVTGGKLAAYFGIRDDCCGRYLDELDAVANSLIWQVNRLHSQGAGLTKLTNVQGQIQIPDVNLEDQGGSEPAITDPRAGKPLGDPTSGNIWYKDMQTGNVNFYFYNTETGEYLGTKQLDFGSGANFDPSKNSIQDVVDALAKLTIDDIDDSDDSDDTDKTVFNQPVVQDNKLLLSINTTNHPNLAFAFGEDTTGLLAALGLNTFFSGTTAASLAVSTDIANDYTKVSAGRVNGGYEVNVGDNTIATAIGGLANKNVTIRTFWKSSSQSLSEYYAALVSTVGSDKLHSESNQAYHKTLADALYERKLSVSGVNLDEEMTNLVKYQSAYKAAAKLITTADEMMGVLIGLKQ